jgi:hypothetical protein
VQMPAATERHERTMETRNRYRVGRRSTCTAHKGLRFYQARAAFWAHKMGAAVHSGTAGKREHLRAMSRGCPRYLASLWRSKARAARKAYGRWLERHTLRDFPVKPGANAWLRAIQEAQKVFPGTDGWLYSCSDAEGGHGRWVRYGGGSYYPGYERTGEVGNWLQFRWPTFKGMYRHALSDLYDSGYRVPRHLRDPGDVRAWLSPLATALAGGWGISHGMRSHWFASIGHGC